MDGEQPTQIANHSVVEKSIRRLREMGLKVQILPKGNDEAYIFIKLDSIIKLIDKQITYPKREVKFEDPFIVIKVWRG
ncbi:hypothetical protein KEJ48_05180 [Candidatus Bathyarchaeota archaeon]|nr:hypothetical protein [Candidatus Bathyarchaeota archaeon]